MNMKWIWNEYEMTWSPISTRWNTTQICLVFHRSCHFLLCSWISRSFSIRSSICVMFSSSSLVLHVAKCVNHSVAASKSVVPCGGYRWWYEYYWNPLCCDVLFICLRTFHREICQILIILTHKVAVAEIYSAFGPFFWPSLMQIFWCPSSGVPHKNGTLISP